LIRPNESKDNSRDSDLLYINYVDEVFVEALNWENNLEKVGFEELSFSSGLTIPTEIIVLNASSTEIARSLTDDSGTNVYQPVVGLGEVGIKTLNNFSSNSD
jgi:hypothetical protein